MRHLSSSNQTFDIHDTMELLLGIALEFLALKRNGIGNRERRGPHDPYQRPDFAGLYVAIIRFPYRLRVTKFPT
jgi:hypothetical protein